MSNTVETYQNLVTSEFQNQPDFMAVISLSTEVFVQVQSVLSSMIQLFDLTTPPVGDQLDIIGQWVGASRNIENPFSGVFFTWDGSVSNGWDYGVWQSAGSPSAIVTLPDDAYLNLILAKIASNSWDGTTEGAYAIWKQIFPQYNLLIIDFQDMSFSIALQGAVPDSLTLALLTGGYLPLRPEGVEIVEYFIPVNAGPLFAWDVDNSKMQGWDAGSWAAEYLPT